MRLFLTMLATALLGGMAASAQIQSPSPEWTIYSTSNSSIPSDYVSHMALDRQGVKWIQCGGLTRFDGTHWSSQAITTLDVATDSKGNIWCASDLFGGSVSKFDGTTVTQYTSETSGLQSNWVTSIAVDSNDVVYAGCTFVGVSSFDGTTWTNYNAAATGITSIGYVQAMHHDGRNLWVGSDGAGLVQFDGKNWKVFNKSNSNIPAENVTSIAHAKDGTIWIATLGGGVASFDGTTFRTYTMANSGLPSDSVRAVTIDSHGVVWAGTLHGLARLNLGLDGGTWTIFNAANSGLPWDVINALLADTDGTIWVATEAGGLAVFNPSTSSVAEVVATDPFSAAVYPNPARDRICLALQLDRPTLLRCNVVDNLGRTVAMVDRAMPAGASTITIPAEGMAPGLYHCVVENGRERRVVGVILGER